MKQKKSVTGYEKHIVQCPECGKDILDHMTVCPFCKAPVATSVYSVYDAAKVKKIRLALTILLIAAIVLIFAVELAKRYR
ncbi:MAG: hypothetical protein ACYCYM_09290 [Saccharofermentanales bacterium]